MVIRQKIYIFLDVFLIEKCPGSMQKAGLHWHSVEAEGLRLKTDLDLLHALGPLLRNGPKHAKPQVN
jgi:hypothetical protein